VFRRRRPSPEGLPLQGFRDALEAVEAAKEAAVAAVPSARAPGIPLAECVFRFERELGLAQGRMDAWRHDDLTAEWEACLAGVAQALRRAEDLRMRAPDLGHESLLFELADLIAPLEPFEQAAQRFRALGSRLR
jgi:hypothetical protein